MTREELKYELIRQGVKERMFDLCGTWRDDVYCLDKVPSGWVVYFRERDRHVNERLFGSEDEACRYFLQKILKDPTTRGRTVEGLKRELKLRGIRGSAYDIGGSGLDQAYCIDKTQSGWVTYYRELGERIDEKIFGSEDEACQDLLERILRAPVAR